MNSKEISSIKMIEGLPDYCFSGNSSLFAAIDGKLISEPDTLIVKKKKRKIKSMFAPKNNEEKEEKEERVPMIDNYSIISNNNQKTVRYN